MYYVHILSTGTGVLVDVVDSPPRPASSLLGSGEILFTRWSLAVIAHLHAQAPNAGFQVIQVQTISES